MHSPAKGGDARAFGPSANLHIIKLIKEKMDDEKMDDFFGGVIVGLIIGFTVVMLVWLIVGDAGNDLANRALTCMEEFQDKEKCAEILKIITN